MPRTFRANIEIRPAQLQAYGPAFANDQRYADIRVVSNLRAGVSLGRSRQTLSDLFADFYEQYAPDPLIVGWERHYLSVTDAPKFVFIFFSLGDALIINLKIMRVESGQSITPDIMCQAHN